MVQMSKKSNDASKRGEDEDMLMVSCWMKVGIEANGLLPHSFSFSLNVDWLFELGIACVRAAMRVTFLRQPSSS